VGAVLLLNADPVRTYPDAAGWRGGLASGFVVSFAMFEDESTKHANVIFPAETHAEKEGVVTHPEGRLQRVRRNVPHPKDVRAGWQVLIGIASALGTELDFETAEDAFLALSKESPFYGETAYEEIGGQGLRWAERDPGESWVPDRGGAAGTPSGADSAAAPAPDGLVLGTYRDLWASEVTGRNPALRFLAPEQKLELAAKDAKELELANGDAVTVSVNGHSVEAVVAIRERMRPGAAFLIEGTDEGNANVLANGVPQRIQVAKR
jgi:NADH-quinone oxidoreductase subunit G